MKFKSLELLIAASLIFYALIALAGNLMAPKGEYFPFFSWSLFSTVPSDKSTFELHIYRIGDMVIDPPQNFFALREYFEAAQARSSRVSKAARRFGRALRWEREDAAAFREVFEAHLLREHSAVEYAIVRVRYRPLERWRTGVVDHQEVVARFIATRDR